MLGRNDGAPALFQMIDIERLVPDDHLLRRIDGVLDTSFAHEVVAECYSSGRGRPSVDPELALRMMILGELYDLSDRKLCEEVQMHAGMRWFLGLDFHDPVPDHSTLSKLRNVRWAESGIFDRLWREVLRQCTEAGLVSGRHLSVDGTIVEADASMKSVERRGPRRPDGPPPDAPPSGKQAPAPEGTPEGAWEAHGERFSNETHVSTTDPDARLYRKGGGKEAKLSYLVHDLIDTKSRVILKRTASLASGTAERETALEMIDEVLDAQDVIGLPRRPAVLTGDSGYGAGAFVADVLDRDLLPHVPLLAGAEMEELPTWQRRTTNLEWLRRRNEKVRIARARNRVRALYKTRGYVVSRKLRIRSEHTFAEAKGQHGLRRARRRGLENLQVQATLSGVVQNLKRLAAHVRRRPRAAAGAALGAAQDTVTGGCRRVFGRLFHAARTVRARIQRNARRHLKSAPLMLARSPISSTAF